LLAFTGGLFEGYREVSEQLFQLDDVADGFGYERKFKFFIDSRVVSLKYLSDLVGGSDDKREGSFEEQDNSSHLSQDIGPRPIKDFWFVEDFKVFLHGTI
jgi:hypothetical protein